jgi:hypothetical protein
LNSALNALGDRLEKPGKERLTLTGTLKRQNTPQAIPFRLVLEWPLRMRLDEECKQQRVIGFDGSNGWTSSATLSFVDQATIETLVYDSVDNFYLGQMQGIATRTLGSRFRLDDGTTPNYAGPFYDIYQVTDRIKIGAANREQSKLFYVNSDTNLFERISYRVRHGGATADVEIRLGNWRKSDGQQIPGLIERLENKQSVLTLTIATATVGPRLADGIFSAPETAVARQSR